MYLLIQELLIAVVAIIWIILLPLLVYCVFWVEIPEMRQARRQLEIEARREIDARRVKWWSPDGLDL
jgi:hypothetical protein